MAGNLRELRNVIKRSTLLTEGDYVDARTLPFELLNYEKLLFFDSGTSTTLSVQDLPPTLPSYDAPAAPKPLVSSKVDLKSAALEAEYEMILNVLKQVNFNKSKAAQALGIDRKTLYNKMKNINLSN